MTDTCGAYWQLNPDSPINPTITCALPAQHDGPHSNGQALHWNTP